MVNRNTIPGDPSAADPSGIRLGTPWITQRGFKEAETVQVADLIADVLQSATPFNLEGRKGGLRRTKIDFSVLEEARLRVRDLAERSGIDPQPKMHGYPHFYYLDDQPRSKDGWVAYDLSGERLRQFLDYALSAEISGLAPGQSTPTYLHTPQATVEGALTCLASACFPPERAI